MWEAYNDIIRRYQRLSLSEERRLISRAPNSHISHFLGEEKLKTGIVGIIKSPALTRKPYYGKINSTYIFELEAIKGHSGKTEENEWLGVKGLAQIRIQTEEDYGYGDRLVVRGTRRPAGIDSRFRI